MSSLNNVLPLRAPREAPSPTLDGFGYPGGGAALRAHVAGCMHDALLRNAERQPADWVAGARDHLCECVDGRTDGAAAASVTALHLMLSYVDHLEAVVAAWMAGASA